MTAEEPERESETPIAPLRPEPGGRQIPVERSQGLPKLASKTATPTGRRIRVSQDGFYESRMATGDLRAGYAPRQ